MARLNRQYLFIFLLNAGCFRKRFLCHFISEKSGIYWKQNINEYAEGVGPNGNGWRNSQKGTAVQNDMGWQEQRQICEVTESRSRTE